MFFGEFAGECSMYAYTSHRTTEKDYMWHTAESLEAFMMLLSTGIRITNRMVSVWFNKSNPLILSTLVAEINRRGITGPDISHPTKTWYHCTNCPVEFMDQLFDIGMQAVDTEEEAEGGNIVGTPLYKFARDLEAYDGYLGNAAWWRHYFTAANWLIKKEVKVNYVHPESRTTPVHLLGEGVLRRYSSDLDCLICAKWYQTLEEDKFLIQQILTRPEKDACECACSENGCEMVTVLADVATHNFPNLHYLRSMSPFPFIDRIVALTSVFLYYDPELEKRPAPCRALFRALTFHQLGLTHTCHIVRKNDEPYDALENHAIHDIEKDDIELLERLVEGFCASWAKYNGSLLDFLRNVWMGEMESTVTERSKVNDGYEEKLQELGVVLGPAEIEDQEEDPSSQLPELGTWEWFQKVVGIIGEGCCDESELQRLV
jgi:hypothetical protein